MQKITSAELKLSIQQLEDKQTTEWLLLKEEFNVTFENAKPLNIIMNSFKEFVASPDLKTKLINGAIGFATGYIAKKVAVGGTHNPIMKIAGTLLEVVVANKVSKNADGIKSIGTMLINKLIKK